MIVLTARDNQIIDTLKILKIMTSSQIQRLFFTTQPGCSRRLKQLVNHKKIKVHKENFQENIYYHSKLIRQQRKSCLMLSEFYVQCIVNDIKIIEFKREYYIPNTKIRTDGIMKIMINDQIYEYWIEVDLTRFDSWKYEKELKNIKMCPIISISPFKRQYSDLLEVYHVKHDFADFDKLLCLLK